MKSSLIIIALLLPLTISSQVSLIKKNETCLGRHDGSIEVVVQGIDGPFKYTWSNGFTGKKATGLAPGDYSVTVSLEDGGCMDVKAAKIWPGKEVSVNISSQLLGWSPNPIPCGVRPSYTFKLTAVPSGGTPPYYCSWGEGGGSGGECSKTVSGQFIDETVVLIDDDGCVDSDGFSHKSITRMCPKDPNDISGPDGYSEEHWISVHDEMDSF